jgi:hypothetical protein
MFAGHSGPNINTGQISSFAFEPKSGNLTLPTQTSLNQYGPKNSGDSYPSLAMKDYPAQMYGQPQVKSITGLSKGMLLKNLSINGQTSINCFDRVEER